MKTKDIISLVILGIILVVLGTFLSGHLSKGSHQRTAQVEVVQPIDPTFSSSARDVLLGKDDQTKATDYSAPLNLKNGFGNTNPFRGPR